MDSILDPVLSIVKEVLIYDQILKKERKRLNTDRTSGSWCRTCDFNFTGATKLTKWKNDKN